MPKGDVKSGWQSVAAFDFLDIRPPAGEEWVVHNIYHEDTAALALASGAAGFFYVDDAPGQGFYAKFQFHPTNAIYLRVLNSTSTAQLIGYDGVVSKAA